LGLANSISDDEKEQLDAAYKKYIELHAEYKKAVDNYNLAVIESNRERAEQEIADGEAAKQRAKEIANAKIEEERRALAEIKKLYEDDRKERAEYWLNDLQLQQKRLDEWVETEKDVVRNSYAKGLINEAEYLDQIFQIDLIYMDKKRKLDEEAAEWSIKYFEDTTTAFVEGEQTKQEKAEETAQKVTWATMEMGEKINAIAGLTGTAFGQTAQMLNTLAQQQDKTSEEGFEAAKKMSIGAAVMSMLQGIISSWTSAMSLPAPISFITGGLMSAFTATLGGIQIDQIKKQTFQNADKGGSTKTPTPSINTAALMSNPINYTTEIKGAQAEEVIPQRIYVVESDITSTQTKVKTVEEESTF
jgi:hypothetical protein